MASAFVCPRTCSADDREKTAPTTSTARRASFVIVSSAHLVAFDLDDDHRRHRVGIHETRRRQQLLTIDLAHLERFTVGEAIGASYGILHVRQLKRIPLTSEECEIQLP